MKIAMFQDRKDAGLKLAKKIKDLNLGFQKEDSLILALPRGGVVVGSELAKLIKLPLDIVVTRKIGHPLNPEYAVAAVSEHSLTLSPFEKVARDYLEQEALKERQEIKRRLRAYRGKQPEPEIKHKNIILVDDGLATGLTMEAAIKEVEFFQPSQIVLAMPVAPVEPIKRLEKLVSRTVILAIEPNFWAVGQFYHQFPVVNDQEVKELLAKTAL